MLVLVEQRELVMDGFRSLFRREGVCVIGLAPAEFSEWFATLPEDETAMIEAVLIGDCADRMALRAQVARRIDVPVFALLDGPRLEETLRLLDQDFDDVLRKPVHVREILARAGIAARRRKDLPQAGNDAGDEIRVFLDGREPVVAGQRLDLPRRERRVLEVLYLNAGRRVSKAQLFSAVYGLDDEAIEETVIESHISKLRKKLRSVLGYDPINSQRFLGYCWQAPDAADSPAQAVAV